MTILTHTTGAASGQYASRQGEAPKGALFDVIAIYDLFYSSAYNIPSKVGRASLGHDFL
jgi:hypothetical protein